MSSGRVCIGFVRRVHGLKGEIEVETFDPQSRALRTGMTVWIPETPDEDAAQPRRVLAVRTGKEGVVLRVEGVDDRDSAERVKGRPVHVEREALPEPAPGEFYLVDILGYRVETLAGVLVGELADARDGGGQRCLVVHRPEGKELLVPAVPEIVKGVEHERRAVIIDPPEGLLDL